MPTQVQFRRGTETQNNNFTGGAGEITISTTDYTFRIHDGTTVGGHEQAKADLSNVTGDTDNVSEGSTNLYYTNARVDAEIDSYLSAGTGITLAGSGSIAVDTSVIATKTYVNDQIALTIDSAPGALDTLNELAAALGDDANFSTTVTNSLALKAPLASPTFTGTVAMPSDTSIGDVSSTEIGYLDGVTSSIQTQLNTLDTDKSPIASPTFTGSPLAPTAATGTNTTQIATTAFVQQEIAVLRALLYAYEQS